jgi:hypothetical protein
LPFETEQVLADESDDDRAHVHHISDLRNIVRPPDNFDLQEASKLGELKATA